MKKEDLRSMPEWERVRRVSAGRETWMHSDLAGSKYVYRYMDIGGLVATFTTASFRMKAPRLWDDPYERWWCDQLFKPDSALVDAKAYGLCWTTRNRDEPLWRLYTCPDRPTVPAIRVRTSVAKLVERMDALIDTEHGKAFLGRVRYAPVRALHDKAMQLAHNKQVARSAASGLLWKCSQFILEREVRLLWIVTAVAEQPFFPLTFDPESFIDQVMIGPTTDDLQASIARRQLVDAGVPDSVICRSLLYKPA